MQTPANLMLSDNVAAGNSNVNTPPNENHPTVNTPISRPYQRRSEPKRLKAKNHPLIADLHKNRNSWSPCLNSYTTASTSVDGTACLENKLTIAEKFQAYKIEKQSWIDAKAFNPVLKNITTPPSNIIGSHVVYKRKADSTPDAIIVL